MSHLLELSQVNSYYGKIQALKGINLTVKEGEIVTLLGSNGAGKSTTLKTISGLVRARSGSIRFMGEDIGKLAPHEIVDRGIVHVPEGRRIFGSLTVTENLELGSFTKRKDPAFVKRTLEHVFTLFPRLKEREKQKAGTLSGGEQQMLAIGRAIMSGPKLLMLDEPSMGLAPIVVQEIMKIIKQINSEGTTILLVEQNAKAALKLAHTGYVIETGQITLHDHADKLREDDRIIKAYLANG
ncbi:ABC transporter ATP-binding protein [Collibacillus ludicampi]|jgi:branched-chain amino acid transport system ATP-binding protein|uniref:ABC transporter ATP-binding protein n=1 Tax=Collibacillus ludicampi TaxID=2771369 RepID=A0AAV4LGV8_9BACL|nr:ABC transporter ATP-binding protein [Collibacillus ludicampi]GIM47076.1 ABC transporter ATP-binding protein [Collibacillus ludicampi]